MEPLNKLNSNPKPSSWIGEWKGIKRTDREEERGGDAPTFLHPPCTINGKKDL